MFHCFRVALCTTCLFLSTSLVIAESPIVYSEFIYEQAPFEQCHASTIEESKFGLVAAWFGGKHEKHPSVGIWFSRHEDGKWSAPVEVANGDQPSGPIKRYPCWNPVLFQPRQGPLLLFYKVGPSPDDWWGMLIHSHDSGKSWSEPTRLPDGILGPIKNKAIQLADGNILCGSSTEHDGWRVHFETTSDLCKTWTRTEPINTGEKFGIIQPAFLQHGDGKIQALCRSRQRRIVETTSTDGGETWSAPQATDLPNPNSGIDSTTMSDGRHILVYNHTSRGRSPLNVAISDDGKVWKSAAVLETDPGEYSYPAVIQSADGMLHVTYTWKRRRAKHVVIDPTKIQPSALWD